MLRIRPATFIMVFLVSACSGTLKETISSNPSGADIYWGKTGHTLQNSGFKTPHSRSIEGVEWEDWCYQLKKDGYHDSEPICRPAELGERKVHAELKPLKAEVQVQKEPVSIRLEKLKKLRDSGLISEQDYEKKKRQILDEL
jgi:hypothetical protein